MSESDTPREDLIHQILSRLDRMDERIEERFSRLEQELTEGFKEIHTTLQELIRRDNFHITSDQDLEKRLERRIQRMEDRIARLEARR